MKGLMTYKTEDPLKKAELMAVGMRMSRNKELIAQKSELFSCKTPGERSGTPMFGGVEGLSRIPGQVAEEEKVGMNIPVETCTMRQANHRVTFVSQMCAAETQTYAMYTCGHYEIG